MIAGTDLLCLGRDQDQLSFLGVKTALIEAVRSGRLPGERLEESAARVGELREWVAAHRGGVASSRDHSGAARSEAASGDGHPIGLVAARRALAVDGSLPALHNPLVVQLDPPPNPAVGEVPWGLSPWLADGSYREISTATTSPAELPGLVTRLLAEATGRSLVVVVRDAHRHLLAAEAVSMLVAARPDTVVLEMGIPAWRPAAGRFIASYGAAYSNSQAAAELLGLITR
jgi:beta-N-acetylhexosaminidase